jgi:HK97 family phage portal protein
MAANIYKKGTSINGYLSTEGNLSEEAREILRSEWAKNFSGSKNAGSVAVLTANLKYTPIQRMTAQEAQLIDNRNFQITEICRMFGVQPIMVYHYLNATTYASVEQMFLSHIVHTMTPWYRLIESSANKHLLTEQDFTNGYYFKFFEQGMLRGDMSAMANWFKSNIEHGIMSPNDCRELLDMNPYDEGDIYLVPLNMATPKQVKEQAELQKEQILNNIAMSKEAAKLQKEQIAVAKQNQANPSSEDDNAKNTDESDSSKKKEKE